MNPPIPVSLITGFLGSGKTTLINRLLKTGAFQNLALVINEFGDIGVDHLLVETADESIVELSDGCLCCTIRGDLVDTLGRLLKRSPCPSRIIIETTGLADPAPVLHAIMGHPVLSEQLRLDGVITVVDAVNGDKTLDQQEEAVKQVAVADRLVLSKSDLVQNTKKLTHRLEGINPTARMLIDPTDEDLVENLFNCGLYDPATKTADVANWLSLDAVKASKHDHHHHPVNRHDARIRAFTLATDRAIDAAQLTGFIDLLRAAHGPNLLRVKGIIKVKENPNCPVVIHGVQQVFHPPATLPEWPDENEQTRLVLITRDLSEEYVGKLFKAFTGEVDVDTADHDAMISNPLSVPGKTF